MAWEVDWSRKRGPGGDLWARNPESRRVSSRDWHFTSPTTLISAGVDVPRTKNTGWEVDWERRDGKRIWSRNPTSHIPAAREWHWVDLGGLIYRGHVSPPDGFGPKGRWTTKGGYIALSVARLPPEDRDLVLEHRIWIGRGTGKRVMEHRLIALKKYGRLPKGVIVRHRNGRKDDNRPVNLVVGSTKDNSADHRRALVEMWYWRERALTAEGTNVIDLLG